MIIKDLTMSKTEVAAVTVEVVGLQAGEVVDSASAVHTPPDGGDVVDIDLTVESPYVNLLFGPFEVTGHHFVKVQAVGDNGSKPEILYQIKVIT